MGQYKDFKEIQDLVNDRFCCLLGVVSKVKNRRHSKVRTPGDGKYSKISNNCARFESNRILK